MAARVFETVYVVGPFANVETNRVEYVVGFADGSSAVATSKAEVRCAVEAYRRRRGISRLDGRVAIEWEVA